MVSAEKDRKAIFISKKTLWDAGIRRTLHHISPVRISVEFFTVIENISTFFRENVPTTNGEGEWSLLLVKKEGKTTRELLNVLFKVGFNKKEVGYAGLKDKRAIAYQWISVPYHKKEEAIDALERAGYRVLSAFSSKRKIRTAKHSWNVFLALISAEKPEIFEKNVKKFFKNPVFPNYFGFQRFGNNNDNLSEIWRRPTVLRKKNFLADVFRSYIFNLCLSNRIPVVNVLPGDFVRFFSPTGPIYGKKMPKVDGFERDLEEEIFDKYGKYLQYLKKLRGWRRSYFIYLALEKELQIKKLNSNKYFILAILPKGAFFSSLLFELSKADITWSFLSSFS